ncbi:hypothetical protein DL93DRAFT_2201072 [Clavulina sp. PMI_390]|nr:hypothetical protein DL93DRAFT_2201072 [Clavulina sp. PMI_390]
MRARMNLLALSEELLLTILRLRILDTKDELANLHILITISLINSFLRNFSTTHAPFWSNIYVKILRAASETWIKPTSIATSVKTQFWDRIMLNGQMLGPKLMHHDRVSLPVVNHIETNDLAIWLYINTPSVSLVTLMNLRGYAPLVQHGISKHNHTEPLDLLGELPIHKLTLVRFNLDPDETKPILRACDKATTLQLKDSSHYWNFFMLIVEEREGKCGHEGAKPLLGMSAATTLTLPELKTILVDKHSHTGFVGDQAITSKKQMADRLQGVASEVKWSFWVTPREIVMYIRARRSRTLPPTYKFTVHGLLAFNYNNPAPRFSNLPAELLLEVLEIAVITAGVEVWTRPTAVTRADLDRVSTFLQRSRRSPIDLDIFRSLKQWSRLTPEEMLSINSDWRSMYSLLLPHISRCCSVSISFADADVQMNSEEVHPLQLLGLAQPLILRKLRLWSHPSGLDPTEWDSWNLSPEDVPLQTISFTSVSEYLPATIDMPWPMLSALELDVKGQFWANVCYTLAQLPCLQNLNITLQGSMPSPEVALSVQISLPLVERILTNNIAIWHHINTPHISFITLDRVDTDNPLVRSKMGDRGRSDLLSLLGKLPVQHLKFSRFRLTPQMIAPVLRAFTKVETLQFETTHDLCGILAMLAEERERSYNMADEDRHREEHLAPDLTFPLLKTVLLDDRYTGGIHDDAVFRSMKDVVNRLRALSLDVTWSVEWPLGVAKPM